MPSIKTMVYKFHAQVNNFAGNQTQSPKTDNMTCLKQRELYCFEMPGEIFPV